MAKEIKSFVAEEKPGVIHLDEEHKMYALKRWAEGIGAIDIANEIKELYGVSFSRGTIFKHCLDEKNKIFIAEFRERFLADIYTVPIANKKIRLETLENSRVLINKLIQAIMPFGKIPKSENARSQLLMYIKRRNEVMCVAREEIEGKTKMIQQFNIGQYSSMSDNELQKRKDDLIAKATGVISSRDIGIDSDSEGASPTD